MRTLLLSLSILGCLYALEQDKRDHATAGAVVAVLTYAGTSVLIPDSKPWQRFLVATVSATAVGWTKEVYDRQGHGTYESRDAWRTAAGGAVGAGVCFAMDWSF